MAPLLLLGPLSIVKNLSKQNPSNKKDKRWIYQSSHRMNFNLTNSFVMESGPCNVDFYAIEILQLLSSKI
jgi:hypothetical protein